MKPKTHKKCLESKTFGRDMKQKQHSVKSSPSSASVWDTKAVEFVSQPVS